MSTLSVGTIIFDDGFEIISILSRDDIGIIYLAKDAQLNTSVAIKEYFPSDLAVRDGNRVGPKNSSCAMDYQKGLSIFFKDAENLTLSDQSGATVMLYGKYNGTAYMAMSYDIVKESTESNKEKKDEGRMNKFMKILFWLAAGIGLASLVVLIVLVANEDQVLRLNGQSMETLESSRQLILTSLSDEKDKEIFEAAWENEKLAFVMAAMFGDKDEAVENYLKRLDGLSASDIIRMATKEKD